MKKIFSLLTVLSALLIYGYAQNTSPYWSLAGNSNATSSSKLGTTNAINLRIFTNNLERARVTTSGLVGIGTTSPDSRLHVNSSAGQNAIRAQVNGSTKFFVDDLGGTSIGGTSTPPANGLYVSGSVGIGTASPTYKLHVVGAANGIFGSGSTYGVRGSGGTYGIYGSGTNYGVYGSSTSGYGVVGSSGYIGTYGSGSSYGLYGSGGTYGAYANGTSYGVYGNTSSGYGVAGFSSSGYALYGSSSSSWGSVAYGVYGAYGSGTSGYGVEGVSSSNYGVYGYSTNSYGGNFYSPTSYGIRAGTAASGGFYAAVFDGSTYTFGSNITSSDRNLKKNIKDFSDAMSIINKLQPKNYEFKTDGKYTSLNLPIGTHYGLIAQELEEVLPNLVHESPFELKSVQSPAIKTESAPGMEMMKAESGKKEIMNIKGVNYTELIPIMIKGMQEQDAINQKQQQQINELKAMVETLSKQRENTTAFSTAFLKQNVPNPVNNNTVISYYIPDNSGYAQIKITDVKGRLVKTFNASKGEGQINIKSSELPAGAYNYTLYIGNKTVDTKQMVLVRQ